MSNNVNKRGYPDLRPRKTLRKGRTIRLDNPLLLRLIEHSPDLWARKKLNMKNPKAYREEIWANIAREMNSDIRSVQTRYRSIRRHYHDFLLQKEEKVLADEPLPTYPWEKECEFLKEVSLKWIDRKRRKKMGLKIESDEEEEDDDVYEIQMEDNCEALLEYQDDSGSNVQMIQYLPSTGMGATQNSTSYVQYSQSGNGGGSSYQPNHSNHHQNNHQALASNVPSGRQNNNNIHHNNSINHQQNNHQPSASSSAFKPRTAFVAIGPPKQFTPARPLTPPKPAEEDNGLVKVAKSFTAFNQLSKTKQLEFQLQLRKLILHYEEELLEAQINGTYT